MSEPEDQLQIKSAPKYSTATDYGNFIVASLFIFTGIGSIINHDWWDASGWLVCAVGSILMLLSPAISEENWKRPRYLACAFLFVVGISLLLNAPFHHKKLPSSPAAGNKASSGASL